MAQEPNTIAELKTQVQNLFQRSDSTILGVFDTNIEAWIDDLCRIFPWWFLTIAPGTVIPAAFPIAALSSLTPIVGSWVDRGWLRLSSDTESYTVYHPLEDTQSGSGSGWWATTKIQRLDWVKLFNKDGVFQYDLPVHSRGEALSQASYKTNAQPRFVWWETNETGSVLRFHPIPDDYYLMAVQFNMAEAPVYTPNPPGGTSYSRLLTHAPQAVVEYCLMKLAKYFDESALYQMHREELFGSPPRGKAYGDTIYGGLLGELRKESLRHTGRPIGHVSPLWKSARQAMGRTGARTRRFHGRGYYGVSDP